MQRRVAPACDNEDPTQPKIDKLKKKCYIGIMQVFHIAKDEITRITDNCNRI